MQSALRIKTTVLPGGKIEVIDDTLQAGESVDVIVLPQRASTARQSVVDILAGAPGQRLFHTAEEVDATIKKERDAWDR